MNTTLLKRLVALAVMMFPASGYCAVTMHDAIQYDSPVTLADGSSLYTFALDGTFHSQPTANNLTGRTLDGRWTSPEDGKYVVIARQGVLNVPPRGDDYRRIVFVISAVTAHPDTKIYTGYFEIDELTKIPKPDNVSF